MENIQRINIDVVNHKVYEYIYSKQWDEGREIIFNITDDNEAVNPGNYVMFQMKKPDGHVVMYSCPIVARQAKVTLSRQMTAVAGKIPYQLGIYSNAQPIPDPGDPVDPAVYEGDLVTTVTGFIIVEPSVIQPSDVESSDEFNLITDMATELSHVADILANDGEQIIQAARDSIEYAKRSKSYAVGGTDYDHEGIDDDYDNSKYYYDQTKQVYNICFVGTGLTLYASQWDGTTQTQMLRVDNIIADESLQFITVRPRSESAIEYNDCGVTLLSQGEGTLTFHCNQIPANDLDIYIMTQTSNSYGDMLTSNIIYYPTEPDSNFIKRNDYWCVSYE